MATRKQKNDAAKRARERAKLYPSRYCEDGRKHEFGPERVTKSGVDKQGDRFRMLRSKCTLCGYVRRCTEYPFLLNDMFNVPK